MPRGKNYVNNNKGVSMQGHKSKTVMKLCEYGTGCTRPDCIYRHEGIGGGKREEVCLPFLAGKCTYKDDGCKKRHPKNDEKARLIAKYKRSRCRFGDECYTEGCLYLHPKEVKTTEPNYVEPHNVAFPPLNGASAPAATIPVANSAWKAAPAVAPGKYGGQLQPPMEYPPMQQSSAPVMASAPPPMQAVPPQAWHPMEAPMYPPYFAPSPYFDPAMQGHPMDYYGAPMPPHGVPVAMNFNADAKEFVPGA